MRSAKKIVFFVASFSGIDATAPFGILAISAPLLGTPIELWINRQLKNIVKLPKPSVDAKRLQSETAPSCT